MIHAYSERNLVEPGKHRRMHTSLLHPKSLNLVPCRSNGTTTFNPLTPTERALADQVIAYFAAFVATGDPNSTPPKSHNSPRTEFHSPTWKPHTSGTRLVFRAESGGTGSIKGVKGGSFVETLDGGEVERCKVWEEMGESLQV